MDGSSKLTPLIIGKSKAPMCLRGCRSLPVKYTSNGKAWMTRVLFEDWLRDWDEKLSESGRKIFLLLDNCSAHHCGATLKNIQLRFLPPNATSVLQPLDQGIIRAFKQGYRKRVVEQLLTKLRVGKELKIDLLGAIEMLSRAWSDIAPNTIKNCFRHAGLYLDNDRASTEEAIEVTDDDLNEMWRDLGRLPDAVPDGVELEDFLGVDDDVAVTSSPSDNEIVAEVVAASANDDDDEEAEDPEAPCPTLHEALAATEVLRRYVLFPASGKWTKSGKPAISRRGRNFEGRSKSEDAGKNYQLLSVISKEQYQMSSSKCSEVIKVGQRLEVAGESDTVEPEVQIRLDETLDSRLKSKELRVCDAWQDLNMIVSYSQEFREREYQ
ncbi:tigger transposable element-derived protein 6-like [Ixodes scapularis]|uniref:tigger transposable element-derived protein 6-like n=1 Tax=Ixodes scapularis TaxID=6945 RepID=UPI001C390D7A|nr:tigger transposable element-derived protein 6-like [Ixodes scapularis]